METIATLHSSRTYRASAVSYRRYADSLGRKLTPRDVAEIILTIVACRVYPRGHTIHVRRCIEVENTLPSVELEVPTCDFDPEKHVIVTCVESHVNHSLGLEETLCGASVRGWRHGKCVVWW